MIILVYCVKKDMSYIIMIVWYVDLVNIMIFGLVTALNAMKAAPHVMVSVHYTANIVLNNISA
jgi:hypothetical protein